MTFEDVPVERAFKSLIGWLFHNAKNFVFLGLSFYGVLVWSIQPRFESYAADLILRTVDDQIGALQGGQATLEETLKDVKTKQNKVMQNQGRVMGTQRQLAEQLEAIAKQIERQQQIQKDDSANILRLLNPGANK